MLKTFPLMRLFVALLTTSMVGDGLCIEPLFDDPARDDLVSWQPIRILPVADSCQQHFLIETKVDQSGIVEDIRFIEPNGLIQNYNPVRVYAHFIKKSVSTWRFKPSEQDEARFYQINIFINGYRHAPEEGGYRTVFRNPLTFIVEKVIPTVELMERHAGKAPSARCGVHDEPMQIELVPISYGLPKAWIVGQDPDRWIRKKYYRKKKRHFPNAPRKAKRGCIVSSEKAAEVFVCRQCQDNRDLYVQKYPKFKSFY